MSYPINLVTGAYGENHVKSSDDGSLFASIVGLGQYIINGFDFDVVDNNTIRIKTGDLLINGRHAKIDNDDSVSVKIENGSSGVNRIDLIVATYTNAAGNESVALDVIKGISVTGTPTEPPYTEGDIMKEDTVVQMPLFRVNISGIVISSVDVICEKTKPLQQLILDMIVPPVGWIEYNESGINPSTRYPGTVWELTGQGAVSMCVNPSVSAHSTAGNIIGSDSFTIAEANLPQHKHAIGSHTHPLPGHKHKTNAMSGTAASNGAHTHKGWYRSTPAGQNAPYDFAYADNVSSVKESSGNIARSAGAHTHTVNIPATTTAGLDDTTVVVGNPKNPTTDTTGVNSTGKATSISLIQKSYLLYRWKRTS